MVNSGLFVALFIAIFIVVSLLACVPFAIEDQIYLRKKRKERRKKDC
ncbi:MAG: hypothetical protein ACTSO3_16805 [Candidatus Heimdallarchaeaceae archaeon]